MRAFIALTITCVCAAQCTAAQLTTPLPVTDLATADLNSDGVEDIIALCAKNGDAGVEKSVAVFLSNEQGVHDTTPVVTPLPSVSGPAFMAACEVGTPKSLIVRVPSGAAVYTWGDKGFTKKSITPLSSILPVDLREPRFLPKTAHDLNEDGIDEWLIPAAQGFTIHNADKLLHEVRCDTVSRLQAIESSGALIITHNAPAIHVFDLPDGGGHAIAFLTDEYADFAFGPNFEKHARFKVPVNVADKWDTMAQLHDITNNGLPDLVVTQTQGTINLKVQTQIYLAEEPFVYPDTPSASFDTKGSFAMPMLIDVNGDEYADLVTIKIPFGVTFFANLLLRQKLKFKVDAHMFENGGFAEEPDISSNMTIDAPDGREQAAYTLGDFDADGRLDVALGSGGNRLRIHRGEAGKLMSSDPWQTLDVSPIGTARALDLNHSGGDDLIIFHPGTDQGNLIEVVLF